MENQNPHDLLIIREIAEILRVDADIINTLITINKSDPDYLRTLRGVNLYVAEGFTSLPLWKAPLQSEGVI